MKYELKSHPNIGNNEIGYFVDSTSTGSMRRTKFCKSVHDALEQCRQNNFEWGGDFGAVICEFDSVEEFKEQYPEYLI